MSDLELEALGEAFRLANRALKSEKELNEAKQLLKEAVEFMNLVPNNIINASGQIVDETLFNDEETVDHYKLCSRIDKFLRDEN